MQRQTTIAILGAGSRGLLSYGAILEKHPDMGKVVAVADARESCRNDAVARHSIEAQRVFTDWREFVKQPRMADAVIIATQDHDHREPAIACADLGYDILLEKPMDTTEAGCREIIAAVKRNKIIFAVCHVLRFSKYFRTIRDIVQSGRLGQIASVRHMEQVGYWHQAHSYVRGNWRKAADSSPMILAKSCHDMDILLFMLGRHCKRLSSFGSLTHFKAANKPAGAAQRCVDCVHATSACPYAAPKYYLGELAKNGGSWPVDVITRNFTREGVLQALREGPYGKCVYDCDNDVVDHQVVAMEFEQQLSATFTMTAFTEICERMTDIFGSHGELRGLGQVIEVTEFATETKQRIDLSQAAGESHAGHLGGDAGLLNDFVTAVRARDQSLVSSGPDDSLESHLMAFAAERSRLAGTVELIEP